MAIRRLGFGLTVFVVMPILLVFIPLRSTVGYYDPPTNCDDPFGCLCAAVNNPADTILPITKRPAKIERFYMLSGQLEEFDHTKAQLKSLREDSCFTDKAIVEKASLYLFSPQNHNTLAQPTRV